MSLLKLRSLSWSSSSSPPSSPTPTTPPSSLPSTIEVAEAEDDTYSGLVRFSDACILIPSSSKRRKHSRSPSVSTLTRSCLRHNRDHSCKPDLDSAPPDPPVVRSSSFSTSPPSSPVIPSHSHARSSSFLSYITRSPSTIEEEPIALPLRACCPQCAASFMHPASQEKFTKGARRRHRSASVDGGRSGGFHLVEERCQIKLLGMGVVDGPPPIKEEEDSAIASDGVLDSAPGISRGRTAGR